MLVGQVGFHRTIPLVLHGTSGIGRTQMIERVGRTGRIHRTIPHVPWDRWDRMDT